MSNLASFLSASYILFQLFSADKLRCPLLYRSRMEEICCEFCIKNSSLLHLWVLL